MSLISLLRGTPSARQQLSRFSVWKRNTTQAKGLRNVYTVSSTVLDEWVQREARPISLRQLTFFGRTLTEERLLGSANYVRTELPTRIAHRLRDMQSLPYSVITNPHMSHVYGLYYSAFDRLRQIGEIRTTNDNHAFCKIIKNTLREHLSVIPRLATGVLEVQGRISPEDTDKLVTKLLRSRISRRVIAEQHLALTEIFSSSKKPAIQRGEQETGFVGEVFLKCNAREVVEQVANTTRDLIKKAYGPDIKVPEFKIEGHLEATLPYILSHLEYILGELLRNSVQAVIQKRRHQDEEVPPIEVLICETKHEVIFRICDQGGGIDQDVLRSIWSFSKGPRKQKRLENLGKIPKMAALMNEVGTPSDEASSVAEKKDEERYDNSLSSLYSRRPEVRLGIGLPMSKVYAEYWAGKLDVHNLEGYGVDVFLQISKLGNNPEQIERASMDAL